MKKIKEYIAIMGLIVMCFVFAVHLVRDVSSGNYDQIDDHFYDTFKNVVLSSNETMDQADD